MKVLSQYLPVLWENKTIVNRKFFNVHNSIASQAVGHRLSRSSTLTSLYCGLSLRCQAAVMVECIEKPFNIFQIVAIRKTRCAYTLEKSGLGKLSLFPSIWNHSRENSPNSISCFVLLLHSVVKPLGTNVTIFPLILILKSRPCVLHTNLKQ